VKTSIVKAYSVFFAMSVAFLLLLDNTFAQDTNFWTQQYGTRSILLGGAVIGSVDDLGAVYYNPGLFAMQENPGFVLSARVYANLSVKIEDGAGEGNDLKQSRFGGAPGLVAGSFKFKWAPGHRFGYSLLTRQTGDASFTTREVDTVDIIPANPGDELFGGELKFNQKLDDLWAGLTWAYPVSKKFGIGLTQFLSIRSQSLSGRILLETLSANGSTASYIEIDEYDYKTYRTLTKIGAGLTMQQFTAGLTVTTPSLHISGSGTSLYNVLLTGGDLTGDGNSDDLLEARLQPGVAAEFKSSWAIGIGTGFMIARRVRFHLSGEWFDKIEQFRLLNTEPFIGQSTGDTLSHDITYQSDPIFNYGFGFELHASPKVSWYGSYVKDFSGAPKEESVTTLSGMDISHISGGTSFAVGRSEFTLGISWATGKQDVSRLINFEPDDPDDAVLKPEGTAIARVSRLKFIFGFSLDF
jgi:hypothetical protein